MSGSLLQPVNHKLLVERFSMAVDDAYKDAWRRFFIVADDLGIGGSTPQAVQQQPSAPVSAFEMVRYG